jgi:hypothetical protein
MQKKKNAIIASICIVILVIIAACYGTYYYWVNRGDEVLFSSTGQYGWGPTPLYSMASREGGKLWIGTIHNYGFVRDVHADAAAEAKFKGDNAGGPPGGRGGAQSRPSAAGGPGAGAPGGHAGP